jgi:hypothetical protein
MTARELEHVVAVLARKQARAREGGLVAAACAVLAAITLPLVFSAGAALLAGMTGAAALAIVNFVSRRDLIARLALDPNAYSLAEVHDYGHRLVLPAEREKLAAWLREVVRDAAVPGNWYIEDRVSRYALQLESLATELTKTRIRMRPASAAACHRLLTHAVESPLYNPSVPAEELPAAIERIRRGIIA